LVSALLFDIDGVLIRHKDYFSEHLEKNGYQNACKIIDSFYHSNINKDCDRGKLDPLKEIEPYLKNIKWKNSCNEFFIDQFKYETQYIDYDLLGYINDINTNRLPCYIASNQNQYRKRFLVDKLQIEKVFTKAFFSSDFGYIKPEMDYWDYMYKYLVTKDPMIKIDNIVFFDDMYENVESAKKYGFITYQIERTTNVKALINSILCN
jgi:FMN phosphatase YigB (HAD superfamily)